VIDVLLLPGTGYPHGGDGVCETFMRALDPAKFRARIVSYPATYGGLQLAYGDSCAIGRLVLLRAIGDTANKVVIGGFSAGAKIAGDVAAEIGRGEHPHLEVLGCALIADPERPQGAGMPGRPIIGGYGIGGQREIEGVRTWWSAAVGDPITALGAGSPLRSIADLTEFFSVADPVAAQRWGADLLDRARRGRWQQWWNPMNWSTWAGAVRDAYNYLPTGGGRHGPAYVLEGLCTALAEVVNREVTG
jgi:hypothetical protein